PCGVRTIAASGRAAAKRRPSSSIPRRVAPSGSSKIGPPWGAMAAKQITSEGGDAVDDELGERGAVDAHADGRVRRAEVLATAIVDARAAAARSFGAVDLDPGGLRLHQARVDQVGDADGIVHRGAGELRVAAPVELRVEVDQLGDDTADLARAAQTLGVLV